MIYDKIKNWQLYFKHDVFENIFKDLETITVDTVNGNHFKNENYYFKVMSYDTQLDSNIIENHNKEVDIQIVLAGKEKIKIYNENAVEIIRPYQEEDDCQFYKNVSIAHSEIILQPSYMAVFFKQDIHHPLFAVNGKPKHIKKVVIKVNEKFFT
ncbi:MAG: YhcH/YjgK/YiaL family protein [Psychroserpens sp.]|uniref:YhcH/YjgK/YiaL family protein n=1 Tax=Psychroserpens sp. TaxID=2020870 RepID=UPI00300174E1